MQLPLQVTYRDLAPSPAVTARIREKAGKLERFYDRITACRVVIEAPHAHRHKGRIYHVRIDLTVPEGELVVSREHHDRADHTDLYVALRDAFDAAGRQLKAYARRRRGGVKAHETPAVGRAARIGAEAVDAGAFHLHRWIAVADVVGVPRFWREDARARALRAAGRRREA